MSRKLWVVSEKKKNNHREYRGINKCAIGNEQEEKKHGLMKIGGDLKENCSR